MGRVCLKLVLRPYLGREKVAKAEARRRGRSEEEEFTVKKQNLTKGVRKKLPKRSVRPSNPQSPKGARKEALLMRQQFEPK